MTIFDRVSALKKQLFLLGGKSVRLLAVSKKKSIGDVEEAIHAGQLAFGENYVQEAIEKIDIFNQHQKYPNLEWHYIGRIQKNKIKDLARYFDWVQTIENQETAKKLNQACEKLNKKLNVCIQVNISQESQKTGVILANDVGATGWSPLLNLAKYIVENCPHLCLRGLMTIGLATQDETLLKTMFCQLASCYEDLKKQHVSVDTLSMGMSSDMALAIKCGSTMVRIGTEIFGQRLL